MSRSPSRNQSSPPQAAADSSVFHVSCGPTPTALPVDQPGERVEQAVEVGRDVEAEDLDVVADVSDYGELVLAEHAGETAREAGAAASAREEDDLHRPARGGR